MSLNKVAAALLRHNVFLITGHLDPEADAVASQLALASLLRRLGKEAVIVDQDAAPNSCNFLPRIKSIKLRDRLGKGDMREIRRADCVIVADCPTLARVGTVADLIGNSKTLINIDHHVSNSRFGDINWVDVKAAAVGEMIFGLFKRLKMVLTKEEAVDIYTAILIDTGSFRYSNTTAKTHLIAAELLNNGLDTEAIFENLFETKSYEVTRLLGLSLSTMKKSPDGKVAWMWLTRGMLKAARAEFSEAENFINFPRAVKGCRVALLFKETGQKNKIKVSLRSKEEIDVNKIASSFGGGGHPRAAGCTIEDVPKEAERKVLREVFKMVKSV